MTERLLILFLLLGQPVFAGERTQILAAELKTPAQIITEVEMQDQRQALIETRALLAETRERLQALEARQEVLIDTLVENSKKAYERDRHVTDVVNQLIVKHNGLVKTLGGQGAGSHPDMLLLPGGIITE